MVVGDGYQHIYLMLHVATLSQTSPKFADYKKKYPQTWKSLLTAKLADLYSALNMILV